MKTKKTPQGAIFKYQFTKTMIGLAIGVFALCGVAIGFSVYRICTFGVRGFAEVLQSPFLIAVSLLCIVLTASLLIKSQYIVTNEHYIVQFGLIKSKYSIKDVTALELDTDKKKLTIFVGEQFSVLSISPKWQDEFIAALRKANPDVNFTFTLADKPEE